MNTKKKTNLTKAELLSYLISIAQGGNKLSLNFSDLSNKLDLGREILDSLLLELEKDRFIVQFVIPSSDYFAIQIL